MEMDKKDTYRTIAKRAEGYFKDKGSKFIAYLYPVESEDEIKELLQKVKKDHFSARHHCYAWRLGQDEVRFRTNDNGEPASTAGKPILGQLVRNEMTNVLCIVVRYFGGILLGTSGLINAYRQAAAEAILNAEIVTRSIETEFELLFSYNELNTVMQILKNENLSQKSIELMESCRLSFSIRKSDSGRVKEIFGKIYGVTIKQIS